MATVTRLSDRMAGYMPAAALAATAVAYTLLSGCVQSPAPAVSPGHVRDFRLIPGSDYREQGFDRYCAANPNRGSCR